MSEQPDLYASGSSNGIVEVWDQAVFNDVFHALTLNRLVRPALTERRSAPQGCSCSGPASAGH